MHFVMYDLLTFVMVVLMILAAIAAILLVLFTLWYFTLGRKYRRTHGQDNQ